jgi:hypothetical protein
VCPVIEGDVHNWTYNNLSPGPNRVSRSDAVPIVEPIRPPCRTDGSERWLGESIFGDARVDSDWTADAGLLSPELAAGIHRVKGVRKLGSRPRKPADAQLPVGR